MIETTAHLYIRFNKNSVLM